MKTVFIRAIEATVDEKAALIREAASGASPVRFEVDLSTFGKVPRSPFAYWAGDAVRACFIRHPHFGGRERTVKQGLATADDFRFVRLATEVQPSCAPNRWFPFAKGGAFSQFYADVYLLVDWGDDGAQIKHNLNNAGKVRSNVWMLRDTAANFFFRPGLTWPLRTQGGLSMRVMPEGCIFGHKGPAAFVENNSKSHLLTLVALTNSRPFAAFVDMQMAFGSYEVGVIQRTPVPDLTEFDAALVGALAGQSWSLKRRLDTCTENSHAFLLPALLQVEDHTLIGSAQSWGQVALASQAKLGALAAEIDDHAYRLYGISAEDRKHIEQGFGSNTEDDGGVADEYDGDEADEDVVEIDAAPMVASMLSWALGVAFGRFDVRFATGQRAAPIEPKPFDPLPVCSPGMLTGDDGLPLALPPEGYRLDFPADGILVADPGHSRDLVGAVRSVFDAVFDDSNARWYEAAELLEVSDLRTWFGSHFFDLHIKRYSKSRRKAPIYWQLATASASYSVWIYIHRATSDTLFQILESDFLGGKLDHEKSKLDRLAQEAGANPSAAARREIELQETLVGELSALRTEIARVAPLWKPNLDDGVILNFAPLWRLVPQSRSWQAECKKAWDKLVSGEYDWAHLAMHLWPERVVLKCVDDRSLAIAHGLKEVFWHEDASGTWKKQQVDETTVQKLIDERTSATVKAALRDLLSAATLAVSKGRKPKAKSSSPQGAAPKSVPAIARAPAAEAIVDEATLTAVKAAIARVAGGASKADVLTATGLSDTDWNKAVSVLLDRGDVIRSGQKRGTRYHVGAHGEDR